MRKRTWKKGISIVLAFIMTFGGLGSLPISFAAPEEIRSNILYNPERDPFILMYNSDDLFIERAELSTPI